MPTAEYEALVEKVGMAIVVETVCGVTTEIDGRFVRVFCGDPRLAEVLDQAGRTIMQPTCECKTASRAAIATIYAAMRDAHGEMIHVGVHHRMTATINGWNEWDADTTALLRAMIDASPLNPEARNAD